MKDASHISEATYRLMCKIMIDNARPVELHLDGFFLDCGPNRSGHFWKEN